MSVSLRPSSSNSYEENVNRGGLSFSSVTIRLTIAVEANLSSDPPSTVKKQIMSLMPGRHYGDKNVKTQLYFYCWACWVNNNPPWPIDWRIYLLSFVPCKSTGGYWLFIWATSPNPGLKWKRCMDPDVRKAGNGLALPLAYGNQPKEPVNNLVFVPKT